MISCKFGFTGERTLVCVLATTSLGPAILEMKGGKLVAFVTMFTSDTECAEIDKHADYSHARWYGACL